MNTNKITALYARNAQADPDRIRRQISNLTVFAERGEFKNLQCFTDDGVSGNTTDRPGLNTLMEAVRSNKVETVLVVDGTRLSRKYQIFWELIREMNDHGVRVILGLEKRAYLPKHIHNDSNGLDYTLHGDYYFPDLQDPAEQEQYSIGKWGMMHEAFLKEQKPGLYTQFLLSGKLPGMLADLDKQAKERWNTLFNEMCKAENVSEALKEMNQFAWIQKVNSIIARCNEIVETELIFC